MEISFTLTLENVMLGIYGFLILMGLIPFFTGNLFDKFAVVIALVILGQLGSVIYFNDPITRVHYFEAASLILLAGLQAIKWFGRI